MLAKTPLASDKIEAPAACAVPFRPYCGGVLTRTRNVSKYMLALAVCLVFVFRSFETENEKEGQHPLTGQRAPPISGGT